MIPQVHVQPNNVLADVPIHISLKLGRPCCKYTFALGLLDERGTLWSSAAEYTSDSIGSIDCRRDAAFDGVGYSYSGVFPQGLFATMLPSKENERLLPRDVNRPLIYILSVWESFKLRHHGIDWKELIKSCHLAILLDQKHTADKELAMPDLASDPVFNKYQSQGFLTAQRIRRILIAPGVQRVDIRNGKVRGTLFVPTGRGPFPTIIDLYGALGGLVEVHAALLASRGIMTLALAYFRFEGLPKSMSKLELDFIEDAANILCQRPESVIAMEIWRLLQADLSSGGVGILGKSKGGELAIAAACHSKKIKALCSINGNISSIGSHVTHRESNTVYLPTPVDVSKVLVYDNGIVNIRNSPGVPCHPQFLPFYKKWVEAKFVPPGCQLVEQETDESDTEEVGDDGQTAAALIKVTRKSEAGIAAIAFRSGQNIDNYSTEDSFEATLREGANDFTRVIPAMYPLENLKDKKCMFIASTEDQNWMSPLYAMEAGRRIRKAQEESGLSAVFEPKVILYEAAGHYLEPPFIPFENSSFHRLAQAFVVWGGDAYHHQKAQEDSWFRSIKFFCESLTANQSKL